MPLCGKVCKYLIWGICLNLIIESSAKQITITNVKCQNLDEKFLRLNACILKRISSTISETTVNVTLLDDVRTVKINMELVKKSNNRYNNYLFKSGTFNGCKFLENRSTSPIAKYLFSIFEDRTNINHTCPYTGNILLDRFRLNMDRVKWIPIPSGDYGIIVRWSAQGKERLVTSGFFTFTE